MLARASGYCLFFQDTFYSFHDTVYSFHDTFYSFEYFLFLLIRFNSSASGGQSYNDPAMALTVVQDSLQRPTVFLFHSLQSFLFLSIPLRTLDLPHEVLPLTYVVSIFWLTVLIVIFIDGWRCDCDHIYIT
ncbi:hypothetical protein ARMSODRAFT_769770 [Armillaria solidipes]|uniref:Uncharacterized protein n=1 Tax=Armillaria solidipes TaxID=1076256 RepID=A0A2H3ASS9_9AGAR|nr:hypothetical protein ARMSODRAFT_769770 [Armillaria solidipes]